MIELVIEEAPAVLSGRAQAELDALVLLGRLGERPRRPVIIQEMPGRFDRLPPGPVEIGSIPALRRAVAALDRLATLMWDAWTIAGAPPELSNGVLSVPMHYMAVLDDLERAQNALDTALWRQAVESHRSIVRHERDRAAYSSEAWHYIWCDVMARRWALNMRQGPPEGFLPSTELAVWRGE